MSDLIKQQAVIDKLDEIQKDIIASSECYSCTVELVEAIDYIQQEIYELPTVEAKPVVKGKWEDNSFVWECNQCNSWFEVSQGEGDMNFCPNCGADMRGGKNE